MDRVPAIDLTPFLDGSGRAGVVDAFRAACERVGFVVVSGHGLPPGLLDRAFERSLALFTSSDAVKQAAAPPVPGRQRGYHGMATRNLGKTMGVDVPADLRESFFLGPVDDHRAHFADTPAAAESYAPNVLPAEPPGFSDTMIALYHGFERLSADLLRVFALALDLNEHWFEDRTRRHFSVMSTHHYPPLAEQPSPGQLRTGRAHRFRRDDPARHVGRQGWPGGADARRRLGARRRGAGGDGHQPRRHDGALDQRALGVHGASRHEPARGEPRGQPAPVDRLLHASRLRHPHPLHPELPGPRRRSPLRPGHRRSPHPRQDRGEPQGRPQGRHRSRMSAPFSKAAYAYEALRRRILDGAFQPGERLRLRQLALELSVSEMPVREALRLLQKEGLVVIHLHRGAEVARLSLARGGDVTEARMTLERRAAAAALPHHDAGSCARLQKLLAEMERATARPGRFALKHRAFCTALFAPCPNTFLPQLIEELWDQVWQASSTAVFEIMRHRVVETVEESRAILDHVCNQDPGMLDATMVLRQERTMAAWRAARAAPA